MSMVDRSGSNPKGAAPPSSSGSRAEGEGRVPHGRILCVDDEPEARSLYRRALEQGGHEVVDAGSCADALARAGEGGIDATVVDLILPDGDGLALVPKLRAML